MTHLDDWWFFAKKGMLDHAANKSKYKKKKRRNLLTIEKFKFIIDYDIKYFTGMRDKNSKGSWKNNQGNVTDRSV